MMNDMSEVFFKLESNDPTVVSEIQQFVTEQYQAVKEPWLVSALYEAFRQTSSSRCLQLILDVQEPHDIFLLDKISQDLVQVDSPRLCGLSILGYVIRKQPQWLYKITEHNVMNDLINILKNEDNTVIIMNGLLDLLALMPIVPVNIGIFLQDFFEIFNRVAAWRYQCVKTLPDALKVHLQVGLFAFFHRLYGMFPCNFLAFLRAHYSDVENKENQAVFTHTIRPMLRSVAMHPLLVTHSRELEKSTSRWKKMELHDVIVEPSKLLHEASQKDSLAIKLNLEGGSDSNDINADPYDLFGTATEDPLWTPTRRFEMTTPPPGNATLSSKSIQNQLQVAKRSHDSPPEAAIEATPETTPFVTPVKDEKFKFARPAPTNQVSRQLRLDINAHDEATFSHGEDIPNTSDSKTSPTKSSIQPTFRLPSSERRDSLFHEKLLSDLKVLTTSETKVADNPPTSVVEKSAPVLREVPAENPQNVITPPGVSDLRPSPVKFTNKRPKQLPVHPKAERYLPEVVRHKMLHLDTLKDALTDLVKEEDDEEVTEITGGKDRRPNELSTRHITPQIYTDSGSTSRTVSRLSSSSQVDYGQKAFFHSASNSDLNRCGSSRNYNDLISAKAVSVTSPLASSDCKSGGLHPPSRDTVSNFVRQLSGRIRYSSLCASSGKQADVIADVAAVMAADNDEDTECDICPSPRSVRRRSSSCPDQHEIITILRKRKGALFQATPDEPVCSPTFVGIDSSDGIRSVLSDERPGHFDTVTEYSQTDSYLVYPYEHLFPSALPTWFTKMQKEVDSEINAEPTEDSKNNSDDHGQMSDNPYEILDLYIMKSYASNFRDSTSKPAEPLSVNVLREEICLLRSLLLYDQHQRETIGVRNRRLLGKTRYSRILEEQNFALKDQYEIVQSEIAQLKSELETLRIQKKVVEEERIQNDEERNKEISKLVIENDSLKQQTSELLTQTNQRNDDLKLASKGILRLEAALFNATSEVGRVSMKEDRRIAAEKKADVLRRELFSLIQDCRDYGMKAHGSLEDYDCLDYGVDLRPKIQGLKNAVVQKCVELEALKARECELKKILSAKDQAMANQKNLLNEVKDQYLEKLEESEAAYSDLMEYQLQLEKKVFDLQKQVSEETRASASHPAKFSSRQRHENPEVSRGVTASASVDIMDPRRAESKESNDDGTFVIGSPPSSSGSDRSEMFRRGFEVPSRSPAGQTH